MKDYFRPGSGLWPLSGAGSAGAGKWGAQGCGVAPGHLQRPGRAGRARPCWGSRGGSLQVDVKSTSESPSHGGQTAHPDG